MIEHHLRIGERRILLVEGPGGWGESSPFPGYPCDPERARAAAAEAACGDWPVRVRDAVAVNALVPAGLDPPSVPHGAGCVKVKCGSGDPAVDVERIAAVRDRVGPGVAIRIDANGAWDLDTAVGVLERVARYDLEYAEQPVATLEDLAALRRRVAVPVAADECVRSVTDAGRLRALGAADVLVLKVQPLGGVRAALAVAEAASVPATVTSMLETSIGIAAGLALACALAELPYACGLDTLDAVAGDVVAEPLRPRDGMLSVPDPFPPVPTAAALARYGVDA